MDDIKKSSESSDTDTGESIEVKQSSSGGAKSEVTDEVSAVENEDEKTSAKETDTTSDFERTYAGQPETYETAEGAPTSLSEARTETGAVAPVVAAKKTSSAGKWMAIAAVVLGFAGLGALAFWSWNDAQTARSETEAAKQQLATVQAALKKAQTTTEASKTKETPVPPAAELTAEEKAQLAAAGYACALKDFGCDKVTKTVKKIQAPSATSAGFAVVEIKNTQVSTDVFVKSHDGVLWTVIYEGQQKPTADIVSKFAMPADFASYGQ